MRYVRLAVVAVSMVMFAACGRFPANQVEAARIAFKAAQEAGAMVFAPGSFGKAQNALMSLEKEIQAQELKRRAARSYETIEAYAELLHNESREALSIAQTNRNTLREETGTLIMLVEDRLEAVRGLVGTASSTRGVKLNMRNVHSAVAEIDEILEKARRNFADEIYLDAKGQLIQIQDRIETLEHTLREALDKTPKTTAPSAGT